MDVIDIINSISNIIPFIRRVDEELEDFICKFVVKSQFSIRREDDIIRISNIIVHSDVIPYFESMFIYFDQLRREMPLNREEEIFYKIIENVVKKNRHILKKVRELKLFENYEKLRKFSFSTQINFEEKMKGEVIHVGILPPTMLNIKTPEYSYRFTFTDDFLIIDIEDGKGYSLAQITYNLKANKIEKTSFTKYCVWKERDKIVKQIVDLFFKGLLPIESEYSVIHELGRVMKLVNKIVSKIVFLTFCFKDLVNEVVKRANEIPTIIKAFAV